MPEANIKAVITAEDKASRTLSGFSDNVEKMGSRIAGVMKVAAVAFTAASTAAVGFALKSAADFEQTRIGLENMLGSADKARSVLKEVSQFAAQTPFEFPELAQAVRQLVAFGFSAEEGVKTMKELGDVSAAIGAPINDLAYLMGTLRAQGRAFTIDIRQFAMRGIPIYEYLGKVFNTNTQEVVKLIEAGKVGFPEVQKAFQMMTAEGGKFHGAMAAQSKSLSGLFSTLKDNIGQTARELIGITQGGDIIEGSVFDHVRKGATWIINNLPMIIATARQRLAEFTTSVVTLGTQVFNFLQPSLSAIWNTIKNNLIPVLTRLWKEVIQPLAPVIGAILVGAIWALINVINAAMKVIIPLTNFLLDNKVAVLALAAAFGTLAFAMKFGAIVTAFRGSMMTATASMGAARVATTGLYATLLANPFALVAAAGVAAAVAVANAWINARNAVNSAKNAADTAHQSQIRALTTIGNQLKAGKISQDTARKLTAQVQGRASGGTVRQGQPYVVGEQGREMFVPTEPGRIVSNERMSSPAPVINVTFSGIFTNSQAEMRKLAQMVFQAEADRRSMHGVRL